MTKFFCILFLWLASTHAAIAIPPLEAYGHLPAVKMMQLSASGKYYAFVILNGENRKLAVLSDDGKIIFHQDLGSIKARKLEWVGDDRLLLTISTTFDKPLVFTRAYEFCSIINIDLKTGKTSSIFERTKKIAHIITDDSGTFQLDGHPYKYFTGLAYAYSGAELRNGKKAGYFFEGDHRNLYRVNLDTNEVSLYAYGGEGPKFSWVVGADGSIVAHSEYDETVGVWRLYAGTDRSKLLLERRAPFRDIQLISLGLTPTTVWIGDTTSGATVTEEISVTDGKIESISDIIAPNAYLTDPDSSLAIGVTMSKEPKAFFFDQKLQARIVGTRKAFPAVQMRLISYSRNFDRLIVKTDGGDDSGTYWLVDIKSGTADPIGREYPKVKAADVGPTQLLNYKAADGLEIQAVLTLPPGRPAENLPLVVMPHHGPIGHETVLGFDYWAQAFASAGYAVLQPNYRGSTGSGKDFLIAGFGEWGKKMLTDIADGVTTLVAQHTVDPKRVCIVGWNYGGYAALAGVTLQQNIYRCAVSVAGPTDLPEFLRWEAKGSGDESDATRYWRAIMGVDKKDDSATQAISPVNFAARADGPILLIHGTDDTVVPIEQSERMEAALRSAKKPVEFIKLENEDHWLSRDVTRTAMLKASVTFVKKHNPPE
jgi:dipeptidyl aminopeptidase/acylaminoacyl peptidase